MPASEFYPFASTDTGSNLLSDTEYASDAQRVIGNQPGVARAPLVNKALRQSSLIAAAVAKYIANHDVTVGAGDVKDDLTVDQLANRLGTAIYQQLSGTTPSSGYETVGMVAFFPKSSPPSNWLRCNGAAVSRTSYAALFAAIGTAFGVGDGSSTFNLPDLRGEFLRGLDDGRGVDSGRVLGSWQKGTLVGLDSPTTSRASNVIRGSLAQVGGDAYDANQYAGATLVYGLVPYEISITSSPNEQMAVRPRNVAMLPCIKY